jgi:hypothetical protein
MQGESAPFPIKNLLLLKKLHKANRVHVAQKFVEACFEGKFFRAASVNGPPRKLTDSMQFGFQRLGYPGIKDRGSIDINDG